MILLPIVEVWATILCVITSVEVTASVVTNDDFSWLTSAFVENLELVFSTRLSLSLLADVGANLRWMLSNRDSILSLCFSESASPPGPFGAQVGRSCAKLGIFARLSSADQSARSLFIDMLRNFFWRSRSARCSSGAAIANIAEVAPQPLHFVVRGVQSRREAIQQASKAWRSRLAHFGSALMGFGDLDLRGRVFVTSGLGGMSGAQALAAVITGCVGVIAEVDGDAVQQRLTDGYIKKENVFTDPDELIIRLEECRRNRTAVALVYHGNIVELWERFVRDGIQIELGSDQTSCHNIHDLGYCPVGYTFEEAKQLLISDKPKFMEAVRQTLCRHAAAVNTMAERGMYFWDYGNAFLKEAGDAGAEVFKAGHRPMVIGEVSVAASPYRYASYVEDIMGPLCFDYGFGPFRWVCCSGLQEDLDKTDRIAGEVLVQMLSEAPEEIKGQLNDNLIWINNAKQKIPVVGSKSRILYADSEGRMRIAKAFNDAIRRGELSGPVVLGRDHHDVSGTDSPFRETANIYDGSRYTADMAVQNVIGDSFRGATWVSLHNGGGVGWGEVVNGGFGMVLDGSGDAERRLHSMLFWDVNNGISRRAWARNPHAISTLQRTMEQYPGLKVTVPYLADEELVKAAVSGKGLKV